MRSFALLFVLACGQAAYGQPSILLETNAPGYSPQKGALTVLAPLESFLEGTEGVQRVCGLAVDGKCLIRLDLTAEADPQLVATIVQDRVRLAKTALPPLCTTKILPPADRGFMLLSVEPAPAMDVIDAGKWMKNTAWPRLATVPGVTQVHLIGPAEPRLQLTLDPDRLQAYGLTAGDVAAAVRASRKHFDALSFQGKRLTLQERKEMPGVIGDIPIRPEQRIYLRDLAAPEFVYEHQDSRIFYRNGKVFGTYRAPFALVQSAPGKLYPGAKQGLEKVVTALRAKIPEGMRLESRLLQPNDTTVVMRVPDGMGREEMLAKAHAAGKGMMELPQMRTVYWIAQPEEREVIFYVFADAAKQVELHQSLRAKLAVVEGVTSRVGGLYSPLVPWPGQGAQFAVRLHGKDMENLHKTAELLRARLANMPGIVDVDHFPRMRPEVAVTIDREKMAHAGVQPADIAKALDFHEQPMLDWPWQVTLALRVPVPKTVEEMALLTIRSDAGKPATLLRDVAKIRTISAPGGILHEGGRPCVTVFGNVEGRAPEEACAAIRRLAAELAGKAGDVEVECLGKTIPGGPAQPGPAGTNEPKPKARIIEPTPVTTVMPRRITLTRRIEQPGETKSFESAPIYSKIAGFAKEWRVDLGDLVKKDQLLVSLDIPEVLGELKVKEARVKQAEAELKQAKENVGVAKAAEDAAKARIAQAEADVELWSAEVSRAKDLLKKAMNDQAAVDKCVNQLKVSKAAKDACDADWREKSAFRSKRLADVEVADAQLQVSKASYQQSKDWAAYAEVKAPFDGIITQRNVAVGDLVQPPSFGSKSTPAEPLFIVERHDIMRVVVQVPELDARAVKKGDKVIIFAQALPGQDLIGTVTRQAFALDDRSRTLRVECHLPNADRKLLPGMFVRATITAKIDNAWVLPEAAILNDILADRDTQYCFQVVKGVARRLNVEVGLFGEEGVEVLRKQEPGSKQWVSFSGQEAIITNPAGLVDGQTVAQKPAEAKKKQ